MRSDEEGNVPFFNSQLSLLMSTTWLDKRLTLTRRRDGKWGRTITWNKRQKERDTKKRHKASEEKWETLIRFGQKRETTWGLFVDRCVCCCVTHVIRLKNSLFLTWLLVIIKVDDWQLFLFFWRKPSELSCSFAVTFVPERLVFFRLFVVFVPRKEMIVWSKEKLSGLSFHPRLTEWTEWLDKMKWSRSRVGHKNKP